MDKRRYQRARLAVGKLNKIRHEQARKIDILCNDMVSAHGDFAKHLRNLIFGVDFYESILGQNDLAELLITTVELIENHVKNSNVGIFLTADDGFVLHISGDDNPAEIDAAELESYFTPEVADSISRANHVCSLDDMFGMGLQGSPVTLNKITVAAIPLGQVGSGIGFILICRNAGEKFTSDELETVTAIKPGLSRAIQSCQPAAATSNIK